MIVSAFDVDGLILAMATEVVSACKMPATATQESEKASVDLCIAPFTVYFGITGETIPIPSV